jgi:type I restriction enzyme R subunit
MPQTHPPELAFQKHIADFIVRVHGYGELEQADITDTDHAIAEDLLWAFLQASQADKLKKLADDYGADAREEVFRALRAELARKTPLWRLLRHGLQVRGQDLHLYYPKPRSSESVATKGYAENRLTFRPHFYFGSSYKEVDFVFFLNGLPIVALELKHEKNQTVHDAVAQFVARDHNFGVFQHPFLYLAADTTEVKAATDPRREQNFRWHNTGLNNTAGTSDEYPVEFLYREVLAKDNLLEALAFFLVYVPKRDAADTRPERPAFSLFPRFHQSRMVREVAARTAKLFAETGEIGAKLLINHSAGSGKTLSICWLADRLHSLYKPGTTEKLLDLVVILTDRKSLDKNIRDEVANFTHLKDVVGLAREADDLPRFFAQRKSIIISTQQKFAYILSEIEKDQELKRRRVAFLIDEAHRSQEGRMGTAIRLPFRQPDDPDTDEDGVVDGADEIAKIIHQHDHNQLFVAFTATPSPATLTLFGEPFDVYSEAEAIAEGYIVDVATSILSYKTLYNLHCRFVPNPDEEKLFPVGVVAKALKTVAFQDDGLIQYKSEVILRIFDESVSQLIGGRAKAMIVTSSRVAGLRYFEVIKEKLRERGAAYEALYAFSDFTHPETNAAISEHAINGLDTGEQIEDRFEGDKFRLLIVANKFQTGFDQPLLAGMFLDKPVVDRNAVQTVSRLNRCHDGKQEVVVVDFTNNAAKILAAFARYRKGTLPFSKDEPDPDQCRDLYGQVLEAGVFIQEDANNFAAAVGKDTDAQRQFKVNTLRVRFQHALPEMEARKAYVYLLARFVCNHDFLLKFFSFDNEISAFALFAAYVGPQLIKPGSVSDLMHLIRQTEVIKATVQFEGEVHGGGPVKLKTGGTPGKGLPPKKVTVQDMIDQIRQKFQISDDEALYIRQVTDEKLNDAEIRETVVAHRADVVYLRDTYRHQVNSGIHATYLERGRYQELIDPKYTENGGIFDTMAVTVIDKHLEFSEAA